MKDSALVSILLVVFYCLLCTGCVADTGLGSPRYGPRRRLQFFGFTFAPPPTVVATTAAGGAVTTAAPGITKLQDVDTILTFHEMYEVLVGSNSNPMPSNIGPGWTNLNVVYIFQHYSGPQPWLKTIYGQLITGAVCLLVVVYVVVLLYAVYTVGHRRVKPRQVPRPRAHRSHRGPNNPSNERDPEVSSTSRGSNNTQGSDSNADQVSRRRARVTEVGPVPPDYIEHGWRDSPSPRYENVVGISSTGLSNMYQTSPTNDPDSVPRNVTPREIVVRPDGLVYGGTEVDPDTGHINDVYTLPRRY